MMSINESLGTEDKNVKYILTNIAVLPKNGITTCINDSIMFKTDFECVNWMYLLFDNDHFNPITDIKAVLGVRASCNSCKTSFTHLTSHKKHETKCTVSTPLHHPTSHDKNTILLYIPIELIF